MYLDSLRPYREELEQKLNRQKRISERHAKGLSLDKKLDESQMLYDTLILLIQCNFRQLHEMTKALAKMRTL